MKTDIFLHRKWFVVKEKRHYDSVKADRIRNEFDTDPSDNFEVGRDLPVRGSAWRRRLCRRWRSSSRRASRATKPPSASTRSAAHSTLIWIRTRFRTFAAAASAAAAAAASAAVVVVAVVFVAVGSAAPKRPVSACCWPARRSADAPKRQRER